MGWDGLLKLLWRKGEYRGEEMGSTHSDRRSHGDNNEEDGELHC